jgi:hypothetical protein
VFPARRPRTRPQALDEAKLFLEHGLLAKKLRLVPGGVDRARGLLGAVNGRLLAEDQVSVFAGRRHGAAGETEPSRWGLTGRG